MEHQTSRYILVLAILLPLLYSACARTRMTSVVYPDPAGREFASVLVIANFSRLDYRIAGESKLCAEFARVRDCECLRASESMYKDKDYSMGKVADIVKEHHIESVLILQQTAGGSTENRVRQTLYKDDYVTVGGGGYTVHEPWASYEVSLRSTEDDKVVWYATAKAEGDSPNDGDDLIRSAAKRVVTQLLADGIFDAAAK